MTALSAPPPSNQALSGGTSQQQQSMLSSPPQPNVLWRRKEQLTKWQTSETNKECGDGPCRNPARVNFQQPCVFMAACAGHDLEEVTRLLSAGVDVNTVNIDGMTALLTACIDGNLDMVRFLVSHGADINFEDNEGWTPLHAAASCGDLEIVKYLVSVGANLSACTYDGELAVDIAESDSVVEYLKGVIEKRGIDLEQARKLEHATMLADAKRWDSKWAERPHPQTAATALHVAASKAYLDVLEILIGNSRRKPINLDVRDIDGWTPLHAAVHWNQKKSAELLMKAGANPDQRNYDGHTVWDLCDEEMKNFLNEVKVRVNEAKFTNRPAALSSEGESNRRRKGGLKHNTNNNNKSDSGDLSSAAAAMKPMSSGDFVASRRSRFENVVTTPRPTISKRWTEMITTTTTPKILPQTRPLQSSTATVKASSPGRLMAEVTAVTVSSPPPLTVTANVSVSSSSSTTPNSTTPKTHSWNLPQPQPQQQRRIAEEAEAERKRKSAKARRERRSTQGVSKEDILAAEQQLMHSKESPVRRQSETDLRILKDDEILTTTQTSSDNGHNPASAAAAITTTTKRRPRTRRQPTGRIYWNEETNEVEVRPIGDGPDSLAVGQEIRSSEELELMRSRCQNLQRQNSELQTTLTTLKRELIEKDQTIERLKSSATSATTTTTNFDRRKLEAIKTENTRLKEENAALIRVISKLSK